MPAFGSFGKKDLAKLVVPLFAIGRIPPSHVQQSHSIYVLPAGL